MMTSATIPQIVQYKIRYMRVGGVSVCVRERGEEEEEEEEEVVRSLILNVKYKTILCPAILLADWKEVILHSVF